MNNKSILVIIFATLLAFLCAFFIIRKNNDTAEIPSIKDKLEVQQEVVESQSEAIPEDIVENVANKENVVNEVKNIITPVMNEAKQEEGTKTPEFERIVVQEGSVVEEVEDHGIRRNDDGTYEITREFKMKSPTKYSFVDFGFLEKVTK